MKSDEIIKLAEMQKQSLGFIDTNKIAEIVQLNKDEIRNILNEKGLR